MSIEKGTRRFVWRAEALDREMHALHRDGRAEIAILGDSGQLASEEQQRWAQLKEEF